MSRYLGQILHIYLNGSHSNELVEKELAVISYAVPVMSETNNLIVLFIFCAIKM